MTLKATRQIAMAAYQHRTAKQPMILVATILIALILSAAMAGKALAQDVHSKGVAHVKSRHSVERTVERAKRILEHNEFRVFGIIDHTANAKQAELSLLPTRLLVFGNPQGGTALMKKNRLAGLDLPLKLLIWEDEEGVVWISYSEPGFLQNRHNLYQQEIVFKQIQSILQDISYKAAR